jgi:hypothetical protein
MPSIERIFTYAVSTALAFDHHAGGRQASKRRVVTGMELCLLGAASGPKPIVFAANPSVPPQANPAVGGSLADTGARALATASRVHMPSAEPCSLARNTARTCGGSIHHGHAAVHHEHLAGDLEYAGQAAARLPACRFSRSARTCDRRHTSRQK